MGLHKQDNFGLAEEQLTTQRELCAVQKIVRKSFCDIRRCEAVCNLIIMIKIVVF